MSLTADDLTQSEAADLLRWWLEAGVDVAIGEEPRQWLKPMRSAGAPARMLDVAPPGPRELPADFEGFRSYLEQATGLPLDRAGARRVLPHGIAGAKIMLFSDAPSAEDAGAGQPIGGPAWALMQRMLAAIGMTADDAYSASLACFHVPGARLAEADLARCAQIARHHVALVQPALLLLLGEGPARAILGEPLARARGRAHRIEGVRTVATYHPRFLLQRPGNKAQAWRDLLLLTEAA